MLGQLTLTAFHFVLYFYSQKTSNMNGSFDIVVNWENYELRQRLVRFIMSLVCAIIILGNGLVIMAVIRKRQMRRVHCHLYIVSLSVADLLTGISGLCVLILRLQDRNALMCCLIGRAIGVGFIFCSLHHLTLISIDRLMSIQYPFQYRRFSIRVWKAVFIIFAVWGLALAECGVSVALLYAEFDGKPPGLAGESSAGYCRFDVVTKEVRFVLATTVLQVSVVCICYLKMYAMMRKRLAAVVPLPIPKGQEPMPATVCIDQTIENECVWAGRQSSSHALALKTQLQASTIKPSKQPPLSPLNVGNSTNNAEIADKICHSQNKTSSMTLESSQRQQQRETKASPNQLQSQTPSSQTMSPDIRPVAAASLSPHEQLFASTSQTNTPEKLQLQQPVATSCKDKADIGKRNGVTTFHHDAIAECYATTSTQHSASTRRNSINTSIQHKKHDKASCEQQADDKENRHLKFLVKQCVTTASTSSESYYYGRAYVDNSAAELLQRNEYHQHKQVGVGINQPEDGQQVAKPRNHCHRDIMEDHFSGVASGQRTAYHQRRSTRRDIGESIIQNARRIRQENFLRQNWKIAIAGLKTVIPFAVCIAPTVIYWVIELIYGNMIVPSYYLSICHFLALLLCIVNPIIYSRALPGIKESYNDVWRKLKRQWSRH